MKKEIDINAILEMRYRNMNRRKGLVEQADEKVIESYQILCQHRFDKPTAFPPVKWEQCVWCGLVKYNDD